MKGGKGREVRREGGKDGERGREREGWKNGGREGRTEGGRDGGMAAEASEKEEM